MRKINDEIELKAFLVTDAKLTFSDGDVDLIRKVKLSKPSVQLLGYHNITHEIQTLR